MLFDFSSPSDFKPTSYDFCIVGAGVAGITCAKRLATSGARVLLLEAGGIDLLNQSQELYQCESIGLNLWPSATRLRHLGGTSNHWSGRCRGFEEVDFTERAYFQLPGWPIKKNDIDRYFDEAASILDVQGEPIEIEGTVELDKFFVQDKSHNSPPTRFRDKYQQLLEDSPNIDLLVNANVTELKKHPNGSISRLVVRNYNGHSMELSAGTYILSMGALENARLLLVSAKNIEDAPGNAGGMVGRCLMEHLNVRLGTFIGAPDFWTQYSRMEYATSPSYVKDNNIGNSNITLSIVDQIRAYGRTRKIKEFFRELSCDWGFEKTLNQWMSFSCPGEGVISTLCEQQADPESRVFLSTNADKIGMKKLIVDWRINESDRRTLQTIATDMAIQVAEKNLGRVQLGEFVTNPDTPVPVYHHSHHMGTTRMAETAEFGVVDANSRIFGSQNLYVAGSSVFPSGGAANPTLPIVQLSLRLSEHLIHA